MKLILKEYLASIRERDELDAILPDLLSQMGLDVFSSPSVGGRQYGVDVAAVGSLDGKKETVYLFSVKSKDLTRQVWNSGNTQDLQPSLDDILTTYIPTHLPTEHEGKPIEICLCYGGELKENVRLSVTSYEKSKTTENITFAHWHGERLANLIENHFLREDLLPREFRRLLRKSLALLDEPESSYSFFKELMSLVLAKNSKPEEDLKSLRQLNICLWILYSWCREQDNIESAYLSSELSTLHSWEYAKKYRAGNNKVSRSIIESTISINQLYQKISSELIDNKILGKSNIPYSVSFDINSSNSLDINLKLFDILGRASLSGLWSYWYLNNIDTEEHIELKQKLHSDLELHRKKVISLIANNPLLFTPYKDEHAIDIAITAWFLSITGNDINDLHNWLYNIVDYTVYLFINNSRYPSTLNNYHELLNHPIDDSPEYLQRVTAGSTLYPYISMIAAIHGFEQVYEGVNRIKKEYLNHSNFQMWYPSKSTEDRLYKNSGNHGLTLSDVPVEKQPNEFLDLIFKECKNFNFREEISGAYCWPIILTACRHHRTPMPIDFFKELFEELNKKDNNE